MCSLQPLGAAYGLAHKNKANNNKTSCNSIVFYIWHSHLIVLGEFHFMFTCLVVLGESHLLSICLAGLGEYCLMFT